MKARMIGYQEARLKNTEVVMVPGTPFIQASSACTAQGRGRCALWINVTIPWCEGGPQAAPTEDDISIAYASPRALIVWITAPCCTVDVIVLHADDQNQALWWGAIVSEVSPHLLSGVPRVGFMEMNTQFGSAMQDIVGDVVSGRESDHAADAAVAVGLLGMTLQASFEGGVERSNCTESWFCKASKQWLAIDHIGSSDGVYVHPGSCISIDKFFTCADNLDHRPVSQRMTVQLVEQAPVRKRRRPQYSRDDVRAAISGQGPAMLAAADRFKSHMHECPGISHIVESSSHRHVAMNHTLQGLIQHFPISLRNKPIRKPHLGPATIRVIRKTAALSRCKLQTGRRVLMALPRFAFRWWSAACNGTVFKIGKTAPRALLRTTFCLWRFACGANRPSVFIKEGPKWRLVFGPQHSQLAVQHLRGFIALRSSRKLVSKLSKADWKNLLLHRADPLEQSVVQNDNRSKFSLLRAMKPYAPRKEHRLRDPLGNITAGLVE